MFYGLAAAAFIACVPNSMMVSGVNLSTETKNINEELSMVPNLKEGYEVLKASPVNNNLAQIEDEESDFKNSFQSIGEADEAAEEAEPKEDTSYEH